MKVLSPAGEAEPVTMVRPTAEIADLSHKRILLWNNRKGGADLLLPVIQELVKTRFPSAEIVPWRMPYFPTPEPKVYRELKDRCDAAIVAIGD